MYFNSAVEWIEGMVVPKSLACSPNELLASLPNYFELPGCSPELRHQFKQILFQLPKVQQLVTPGDSYTPLVCSNSQDRAADGDSVLVNSSKDWLDEARDSGGAVSWLDKTGVRCGPQSGLMRLKSGVGP